MIKSTIREKKLKFYDLKKSKCWCSPLIWFPISKFQLDTGKKNSLQSQLFIFWMNFYMEKMGFFDKVT